MIYKGSVFTGWRSLLSPLYSFRGHGKISSVAAALFIFLCFSTRLWAQGSFHFQATDLVDTTPGEDLWEYSYALTGFDFQANQGFSIYFDSHFYKNLKNPRPSPSSIWSVIAVQPDVTLQAPGYLDGLALANSPSFATPFQVSFAWMGQGTPGSQPFDIYNADFSTRFSGQTIVVPEPAVPWLGGVAVAVILAARKNRVRGAHDAKKF